MKITCVDLIRHGEPEGGEVLRGRTDHALTERGWQQFQKRVTRIEANWQRVISSPLLRCQAAASALAQERNIPLLLAPALKELDFGDWEGRPLAELAANKAELAKMWQDPLNFCAPAGEPVLALQQRVLACWQDLLKNYAGEQLLVVSHGGVMRVLAQQLLNLTGQGMNSLAIPYAGWLRFKVYQGTDEPWITLEQMDGSAL